MWLIFFRNFFEQNRFAAITIKRKGKIAKLNRFDFRDSLDSIVLTFEGEEQSGGLFGKKRATVRVISPAARMTITVKSQEEEIGKRVVRFNNALAHGLKNYSDVVKPYRTFCKFECFDDAFLGVIPDLEKFIRKEDDRMYGTFIKTVIENAPYIDQITKTKVSGKKPGVTAFAVNLETLDVKEVETYYSETKAREPDVDLQPTATTAKQRTNPGVKANADAIARLQDGQTREANYYQWAREYEAEKGSFTEKTTSADELYRKNVWNRWKNLTGKI